ncbi:hypothetical protein A5844_001706 [Enterococcus sp. 10A9_DIV0425]|uniref:Uncharacterized protein n=1 Tax=Candidatus Enterococcus wittei TaxID=1987383 RepID=A0A242JY11_9ENTE|nr:DUF916 and DUF3324 domain-containing protein [Enterococcus sp. 10A9_DIV0425]OTP10009.1 hypothetical protein A5844_001706 [Enterococcus sp. 10A9_DIV0425]THE12064.1 DUF916 and DUF3324 domain-containing protein [Enterococcus hirae]
MKQIITYQMNKRSPLRWLFVAISLFLFSPVFVNAEEANLNFYVTPEFPESQLEGSEQYFNLNAEPGSTEKLSLKLQNADDKTKAILITPHTAFTNVMGVVEYGKDAEEADPTLPYSLAELMETPEPIELAGNETKIVEIPLTLPKEAFEGFLAGGLRISEVREEKEEEATDEEGVAIKNEFAYVVGVVVSNSRSSVQPDLELLDVFADQLNYRNVISANLQNFTPTFVNRLKVEATVQKEGEKAILYQASQEQMQMAPNSNFNFPISLAGDRFQSGDYVLKLKATSGEEEWEWERTFTIEADEARRLNRQDVTIDSSVNWWMVGSLILLFLLAVVLSYIFYRKNRENKKNNQNME